VKWNNSQQQKQPTSKQIKAEIEKNAKKRNKIKIRKNQRREQRSSQLA